MVCSLPCCFFAPTEADLGGTNFHGLIMPYATTIQLTIFIYSVPYSLDLGYLTGCNNTRRTGQRNYVCVCVTAGRR